MTKTINREGFTLSEVLLVLSVIGVVSALTIPALVQKGSNVQYTSGLKKAYSTLAQAHTMLAADNNGDISMVFSGDGSMSADVNAMNAFAAKLNVVKNCGAGMGCWYNTEQKYLNGSQSSANFDTAVNNNSGKVVLADGSLLIMDEYSGTCNTDKGDGPLNNAACAEIGVDVNGSNPPNTRGRDYFKFRITASGIYPFGTYNDGFSCGAGSDAYTSDGCTAKILQEGTMSY